jgi:hypothetical protein
MFPQGRARPRLFPQGRARPRLFPQGRAYLPAGAHLFPHARRSTQVNRPRSRRFHDHEHEPGLSADVVIESGAAVATEGQRWLSRLRLRSPGGFVPTFDGGGRGVRIPGCGGAGSGWWLTGCSGRRARVRLAERFVAGRRALTDQGNFLIITGEPTLLSERFAGLSQPT